MDTSKEYILMCEKAEVIQEKHIPQEWDFVMESREYSKDDLWCILPEEIADSDIYGSYIASGEGIEKKGKWHKREGVKYIWLPRQDQLQEIAKEAFKDNSAYFYGANVATKGNDLALVYDFNDFCCDLPQSIDLKLSMEQLWLAFCMYELYQKKWEGEKWLKETVEQ